MAVCVTRPGLSVSVPDKLSYRSGSARLALDVRRMLKGGSCRCGLSEGRGNEVRVGTRC